MIQKSKRYIFMGRFLPVKFFPSSLLNLLSPSPHFPHGKINHCSFQLFYPQGSFPLSFLFALHTWFIWPFPGLQGPLPWHCLVQHRPPPPTPPVLGQGLPAVLAGPRSWSRLCRLFCCVHWNIDFSVCARRLCKNQYFSSSSTAQGSVMELACWCNMRGPPSAIEISQKMAVCFPISLFASERRKEFACRCVHQIPGQSNSAVGWHANQVRKLCS